ncbi:DUF3152 domain-containing protein [Streptomyces sp. NPDC052610]|uniref:DUF3152 domain-containing protein n=1 Tax=Streptomyces sp. NPDC052610 TaxID=3154952 RepID=UPI003439322D
MPQFPDGTPARGVPQFPDGTPARGVPRFSGGTPAHGMPHVRGGHPEQREPGGGWGELRGPADPAGTGAGIGAGPGAGSRRPGSRRGRQAGPRQDYLDAFDADDDVFTPLTPAADPYASVTRWDATAPDSEAGDAPPPGEQGRGDGKRAGGGGKGRAFTGIAAAAVTTVLAVVVAGQVADGGDSGAVRPEAAVDQARESRDPASRGEGRPTPSGAPAPPVQLTYAQKMAKTYPMNPSLDGSGKFEAVAGIDKAPGTGQKYTYRVDVEKGLGLDAELFARAVHLTLNDDRSWAHNGARTFERIHSGEPDFVITLASPGTTADWCAKSGLDTTVDNVSCDSASTERVMINAYRWAQGSTTYGQDEIHAYRQMLINHEVGHRLGYSHVTCDKNGDLAPVMQQQTKFLEYGGIRCKPNPWAYPQS